jgi:hypothetical protein
MAAVIGNQLSIDIYIFIYSVDENKSVLWRFMFDEITDVTMVHTFLFSLKTKKFCFFHFTVALTLTLTSLSK